jgi:hypothetical protein
VARLLLRQKQKRENQQKQVIKSIEDFQSSNITDNMILICRQIIGQSRLKKVSVKVKIINPIIPQLICDQLADVLSYEDFIYNPENMTQLHNLRIACKRLRYTLELSSPLYKPKLNQPIKTMKNLQTLLGEIHDCDVWNDYLPVFLREEKERTSDYFGHTRTFQPIKRGIDFLLSAQKKHRDENYTQFIKEWDKLKKEDFWQFLKEDVLSKKSSIQSKSINKNTKNIGKKEGKVVEKKPEASE